ncbi:hypothetical protein KH172YL63_16950 [Bacillus sp. KH172YL63]|nr:hypothetical protein KH172YL63_16950 [Bacillus sp. KH172YL63]
MKNNLSRRSIENLSIQSAYDFCDSIGIKPTITNLSLITGFSDERILEIIEANYCENPLTKEG